MIIRIVPKCNVHKFLDKERANGVILSALNLFMLGYLRRHPNFPNKSFFWCDGIFGVFWGLLKGYRFEKTRGAYLTSILLRYWQGVQITVFGSLSSSALKVLEDAKLHVAEHYAMPSFNVMDESCMNFEIGCKVVIITLPSPKQEILATHLSRLYPSAHFYCIGGALNMLANPKLDCPIWIQRLGLEFIFRLKSDTFRRILRLLGSAYSALLNFQYLARSEFLICGRD